MLKTFGRFRVWKTSIFNLPLKFQVIKYLLKMNLKLLLLSTILQSTISFDIPDIPSNFVKDLMRKYSKKYVAWYLHKDQKTVQIKRNITDFGR